ncbi:MAG: hypothetical protein KAJ73_00775 [Zetaproteobacteria bacterium]|nr:hypothetical protein [Zetaproteobacteria bacterium]
MELQTKKRIKVQKRPHAVADEAVLAAFTNDRVNREVLRLRAAMDADLLNERNLLTTRVTDQVTDAAESAREAGLNEGRASFLTQIEQGTTQFEQEDCKECPYMRPESRENASDAIEAARTAVIQDVCFHVLHGFLRANGRDQGEFVAWVRKYFRAGEAETTFNPHNNPGSWVTGLPIPNKYAAADPEQASDDGDVEPEGPISTVHCL